MDPLFYHPGLGDGDPVMPEEEAWHAIKVLRLKPGSTITVVDGKGLMASSEITEISGKTCHIGIQELKKIKSVKPPSIHIAMAPTKQIERFEFFLEKATEIGIEEITPIFCANSERLQVRPDRLEKVLISAMKQSVKAYLPKLNNPVRFNDFLKAVPEGNKFIAHCRDGVKLDLVKVVTGLQSSLVLIGPEGDFTREETEIALQVGFIPVSLGESRLRTETAGIVAVHSCNLGMLKK